MTKLRKQKEVIKEFMLVHFDTYDYSKVVYRGRTTDIIIVCKKHGSFEQAPKSHKLGHGCPLCAKLSINKRTPLFGVGINDSDYLVSYVDKNGKNKMCPYYLKWRNMHDRCYNYKTHITHPTYIGCTVSKEWQLFSNFKKWMEQQDHEGKQLDKDILVEGNKVYSKDTCCFVSNAINSLLVNTKKVKGPYPLGVRKHAGKFTGTLRIDGKKKHLGYFSTPEEASNAYNIAKANYIIEKANELKDVRIKEALIKIANKIKEIKDE